MKSFLRQFKLWKRQMFDWKWNSYSPLHSYLIQGSNLSGATDWFSLVKDLWILILKSFHNNSDVFKWAFVKLKRQVNFLLRHVLSKICALVNYRLNSTIDIFFPEISALFWNLHLWVWKNLTCIKEASHKEQIHL